MHVTKYRSRALAALVLAAISASTASAQIILNGSFESQAVDTTVTATTSPNSSVFSNWTVATTSSSSLFTIVDTNSNSGNFPDAVNGTRYLAINGANSSAGVAFIYQDFVTTPGTAYVVGFSAGRGANAGGSLGIRGETYNVNAGSITGGVLGSASSLSSVAGSQFYSPSTFNFTATGTTTRLIFSDISDSTTNVDVLLDNVTVTAVPEPSAYVALTAMASLGFCALRRRTRSA